MTWLRACPEPQSLGWVFQKNLMTAVAFLELLICPTAAGPRIRVWPHVTYTLDSLTLRSLASLCNDRNTNSNFRQTAYCAFPRYLIEYGNK